MRPLGCLVAVWVGVGACSQGSHRPRPVPPPRAIVDAGTPGAFAPPSEVPLLWEGRIDRRDPDAPRFAWPASGFRLRFHGTGLVLRLRDVAYEDVIRDDDYLAVYVDERAPITIALRQGTLDYPVAHSLPPGEHRVRVLKRTETEVGTVTLIGLGLEGRGRFLAEPPARSRRVLAIGDSITAGYGIDGPDAFCHYGAGTANATRTYTFLAAEALEAEYQAIAWSGRGVERNFDPSLPERVPELFERLLGDQPTPSFDHATYVPDVIVVNLGTNDLSRPDADRAPFYVAMRSFVQRLRQLHPRAELVLAVGPMLADDYPPNSRALTKARRSLLGIATERRARGDRHITVLELHGAMPDEGYGCDYHPSLRTHQRMAEALEAHLRARLGW